MFSRRFPVTLCCLLLSVSLGLAEEKKAFRFPAGKWGKKAKLFYKKNIPVLVVSGTPEEMGTAVGKLALKPAKKVLSYPRGMLDELFVGFLWKTVVSTGKEMYQRFPKEYHRELEAMIKAADAPRESIIAGNTMFDIKKIINCSALMVDGTRSATKGPLLGRNLDYPSLGFIHDYSLVTVYKPNGKHAFVSLGFPGLAGCLSGMNDAGLTVAVLEAFSTRKGEGARFNPKGIPYALCYRRLLEECETIAQAKKLLESLPRTSHMNLIVGDKKNVGVFEITPKTVILRNSVEGVCSCTNHFCTEIKGKRQPNVGNTFGRFKFLEQSRNEVAPITVDHIHSKLHRCSLGELTLQTMVFEPTTLKLHVAFGKAPSSQHPLQTIELGPLMKKAQPAGAQKTKKKVKASGE